jgi:hypothetical protein
MIDGTKNLSIYRCLRRSLEDLMSLPAIIKTDRIVCLEIDLRQSLNVRRRTGAIALCKNNYFSK